MAGSHNHRTGGRQVKGRKEIVGDAAGKLGQTVGCGGGHHKRAGSPGKLNVLNGDLLRSFSPLFLLVQGCDDSTPAQGRQSHRGDEIPSVLGKDHLYFIALLLKQAKKLCGLVGGNTPGDTQEQSGSNSCD